MACRRQEGRLKTIIHLPQKNFMAHYAIGDLQGCYDELEALLAKIDFNPGTDTLWLTGDIVNRGPKSLQCLQFCMQHESSVQIVLGNHDLHLLAVAYGHGKIKRSDTISPILDHPERQKMLDWLRAQPLMICWNRHVMVHAGLLPQWQIDEARALARESGSRAARQPCRRIFRPYVRQQTEPLAAFSGWLRPPARDYQCLHPHACAHL